MENVNEKNRIIAEFMGWKFPVVGSKWIYDRSLDHSKHTIVTVKSVTEKVEGGKGDDSCSIEFEEQMAYKTYGSGYFLCGVFRPFESESTHLPERPYHTSWDWLMPVWVRFRDLKLEGETSTKLHTNYVARLAQDLAYGTIEEFHHNLTIAIKWYNQNK